MVNIRKILIRSNELNSSKKQSIRLISRQISRLIKYNEWLSNDFWQEFYTDILCTLYRDVNVDKNVFLLKKIINLENELQFRELQFNEKIKKQKHWKELFSEHKLFFEEYLQKCISLHSKMKLQDDLIENIDDFLSKTFGLTQASISLQSRQCLQEKLQCIKVNFDCSNRSFKMFDSQFSTQDNINAFQPSIKYIETDRNEKRKQITDVLLDNRWTIILGDPGSAKTTLLRWITSTFAEFALNGHEEIVLNENKPIPIRIPILIRIGEFIMWLEVNQTKTLLDYIGEHTWFSECYCYNNNNNENTKNILKELIYHGHALILLDGFDEIIHVSQREKVVDLIKKFIDEYVRASDYFSPFDDKIFNELYSYFEEKSSPDIVTTLEDMFSNFCTNDLMNEEKILPHQIDYLLSDFSTGNSPIAGVSKRREVIETQPPNISGGNQIIITSRMVGYQVFPIKSSFIRHYLLSLMNHNETKIFVKKFITEIDKSIIKILNDEGIQFNKKIIQVRSKGQDKSIELMFKNDSEFLLVNPHLLSLICVNIYQTFDRFYPKCRIEIYDLPIQAALHLWNNHQSTISDKIYFDFLIDFACYLHLNSPSGLIDEFDTKRLCYIVFQRQNLSTNHQILQEYVTKMIDLLNTNTCIFAERGLQIFGFRHLSFQEYFIAHSFLRTNSPDQVAKTILVNAIYQRFRQSILLTIGWISWKWSMDNYDQFCYLLLTLPTDYSIPFGTILFFDAFNDMYKLPSNASIFLALNNILDHPRYPDRVNYLTSKLFQLNDSIIIEWMQSQLKVDDKRLRSFCQCISNLNEENQLPSIIYQQLGLLTNNDRSIKLLLDQILYSTNVSKPIFNKDLSFCLASKNISMNNIHPLIISAIIAVCGGINLSDEDDLLLTIDFSTEKMYRECSILTPIIEYLGNKKNISQIQTLIQKYKHFIDQFSYSDTSKDAVDSFIILICLQGISEPLIYEKYLKYIAVPLALDRLKQTWFYLNNSFKKYNKWMKVSRIKYQIESIIDTFYLHSNQSKGESMLFPLACSSAWKKLEFWNLSAWFSRDYFYRIDKDCQHKRTFTYLLDEQNFNKMINIIHSEQMSNEKLQFLVSFLPESLQQLYYYAMIPSINNMNTLLFVIFLSECLIHFDQIDSIDENHYLALLFLYPLLREYKLENYALILFNNTKYSNYTCFLFENHPELIRMLQRYKLYDLPTEDKPNNFPKLIDIERKRIQQANESQEFKDVRLFTSLITFARSLQIPDDPHKCNQTNTIIIDSKDSKQIYLTINNISNSILRIIASSIILDMKDPLIFDEEQRDELISKIIIELQSLLRETSLLIGTILFIRCYNVCQQLSYIITEKFHHNSLNEPAIKAVFIALKQLNNPDLIYSALLQFQSSIFYRYFRNIELFDSSNTIILSLMYLLELIFDCQILRFFIKDECQETISPMKELEHLWNESSKTEKVLTTKIARWITNNIQILNKQDQQLVIENLLECVRIERKAFIEMKKWLHYQTDDNLNIFSHYSALQLFINDSTIPGLIDIIDKIFLSENKFRLKSILKKLVQSNVNREILVLLHQNYGDFFDFPIKIYDKKIFELFLELEFERIRSNKSSNPYLSMIDSFSRDFQLYLLKYFRSYLNFQFQCENILKDRYFSIIIESINKQMTEWHVNEDLANEFSIKLVQYIFNVPNIEQYPLVLLIILEILDSSYIGPQKIGNIISQNGITRCLENMIYLWNKYTEDILAACLLTYSHYLLNSRKYRIHRNLSNDLKNQLINLSKKSNSLIISIRASFCLIFSEYSNINSIIISNWFENQFNMTSEKRYKILLEQTLYNWGESTVSIFVDEIFHQLKRHSTEFLDLFVIDLDNYLCKIYKNDIHPYFEPQYFRIIAEIRTEKWNDFQNAIERFYYSEVNDFKRKLYLCCKKYPQDHRTYIDLYARFGIVTNEFIEMCEEHKLSYLYDCVPNSDLDCLKDVSDRSIIDTLYQALQEQNINWKKFRNYLWILEYLVMNNVISLLELHSKIRFFDNMSLHNEGEITNERYIFQLLLKNSCYQRNAKFDIEQTKLFTKDDIEEKFQEMTHMIDKRCILYIRKT